MLAMEIPHLNVGAQKWTAIHMQQKKELMCEYKASLEVEKLGNGKPPIYTFSHNH